MIEYFKNERDGMLIAVIEGYYVHNYKIRLFNLYESSPGDGYVVKIGANEFFQHSSSLFRITFDWSDTIKSLKLIV